MADLPTGLSFILGLEFQQNELTECPERAHSVYLGDGHYLLHFVPPFLHLSTSRLNAAMR